MRRFKISEQQFSVTYDNSCSTGSLLKTDFIDDGRHIYLKLSHMGQFAYGKESLCEVISSRIGRQLGFPILEYYPCLVDLMNAKAPYLGCYSYDYAICDVRYTALEACESILGAYSTGLTSLQKMGFEDYLNQVIIFDYLVGNTDRHSGNIEFFLTKEGLVPAPIFDSGKSLLCTYAMYPRMWDQDQITNNFLTQNHTFNTFKYGKPIALKPLETIDWEYVFEDIASLLGQDEMQNIKNFVEHQYQSLVERGLVIW